MSEQATGKIHQINGERELVNENGIVESNVQQQLASDSIMHASSSHRIFPLPLLPLSPASSFVVQHSSSRRIQQRASRRRLVQQITNAAITACNIQAAGASVTAHQLHFEQLHHTLFSSNSNVYTSTTPSQPSTVFGYCNDLPSSVNQFDSPNESSILFKSSTSTSLSTSLHPAGTNNNVVAMTNSVRDLSSPSAAQQRAIKHVHQQCSSFISQCRAGSSVLTHETKVGSISTRDSVSTNFLVASSDGVTQLRQLSNHLHSHVIASTPASLGSDVTSSSFDSSDLPLPIHSTSTAQLASFDAVSSLQSPSHVHSYAVPAVVVPILAQRIALPAVLHSVPILNLLPDELAASYATPASLLRDDLSITMLNLTQPLAPPRVSGSRAEYILLLQRMQSVGMIDFTRKPKAVNGLFAVVKDADADRLIIDAQPANRLFVDPPHVCLPNPSHLVQLQVEHGKKLHLAKSDLSNFYHQLRLPKEWQPYFALPSLTQQECEQLGLPCEIGLPPLHPMCVTLPMGFSHAVFLAQRAHENILYRHVTHLQQQHSHQLPLQQQQSSLSLSPALQRNDNILCLTSPVVDRCVHGLYIDDLWLMSPSFDDIDRQYHACLAAYEHAGLPDSVKKREPPLRSPKPIKAIGVRMDGVQLSLSIAADDRLKLARSTLSILRARHVTGKQLSQLIGSWTWCMLLRRSSLCVLQHTYRYIAVAGDQTFFLWPSVRRELECMLGLLPLLSTNMSSKFFRLAYASDASEFAGGVVAAPLTPPLLNALYPLSSSPHFNLLPLHRLHDPSAPQMPIEFLDHVDSLINDLKPRMDPKHWSVLIASRWRAAQHINVLELHAVLLALRHALSSPASISTRLFMLMDSAVAYYTLWKVRSSSPALLPVLRQINSHLLVTGATLQPCWIPSKWNPADDPSRLRVFPTAVTAAAVAVAEAKKHSVDMQIPFDRGARQHQSA